MNRWVPIVFVGSLLSACNGDDPLRACNVDEDCPTKAYVCSEGYCRIGGDECEADAQCSTPPEPVCVSADVQLVGQPRGTCKGGHCSYTQTMQTCVQCPLCLQGCLLDANGDGALEDVPAGTAKLADACQVCTPEASRAQWSPLDCDDRDVCTQDSCDAGAGCVHTPLCHLAFGVAPPSEQARSSQWPVFTVRVEDGTNNLFTAAGIEVTVRAVGGAGTLRGTTAVTAVAGVATFADLIYDVQGTISLEVHASAGTLSHRVVVGGPELASVAAGERFSCGVTKNGELWCWGRNYEGQLGDGTNDHKNLPTRVGTAADWTAVAAGRYHTCGIENGGELWCWGDNGSGQLGDGTNDDKNLPVRMGTATDWTAVAGGELHTCGVKKSGELWCWGNNYYGQLGDETNVDKNVPTRVGTATDWTAITAGGYHTCGLKNGGELWCWGRNDYGQLGDGSAWKTEPVHIVVP